MMIRIKEDDGDDNDDDCNILTIYLAIKYDGRADILKAGALKTEPKISLMLRISTE